MVVKKVHIEKFRAFSDVSFQLGKRLTAIVGRNGTQKTTVLGMIGQPFTISKDNPLFGSTTLDGYDFKSQFGEKFKFSPQENAGDHTWTLFFHNNIAQQLALSNVYYKSRSIPRGGGSGLRIWNAEGGKKAGSGYIQLPVYYLSLSRLYPIGEASRTKPISVALTDEEKSLCKDWYSVILNVQADDSNFDMNVEQQSARLKYAGVVRGGYDIFTNAAGEGAFSRIALAILSFRRLKSVHTSNYKGGILLIDEVDAAFYPRAQKNLVNFLHERAKELDLQVIFTSHSPEILRKVSELQLEERKAYQNRPSIDLEKIAYDNAMVYLKPDESATGAVIAENITSVRGLKRCLDNMDLEPTLRDPQIDVYCEDGVASEFVQYLLKKNQIEFEDYFRFQNMNLGWSNYAQLLRKEAFRVLDSLIILDADVPTMSDYHKHKDVLEGMGNVTFLPIVVEKELFVLLKDRQSNWPEFFESNKTVLDAKNFGYDTCFNSWTLSADRYSTDDFKEWFSYITNHVEKEMLFHYWHSKNATDGSAFVRRICEAYNSLADRMKLDPISLLTELTETANAETGLLE